MSEHTLHYNQLAADIKESIRPEWEAFEAIALKPSVQNFCTYESRYDQGGTSDRFKPGAPISEQDFVHRRPKAESFTPDEVAVSLDRTNTRLDQFLEGIVESYCNRKKIDLPEDEGVKFEILSKILAGGSSKLHEYMIWSASNNSADNIRSFEQLALLPVSLVMLSARLKTDGMYDLVGDSLEANVSQDEIDQVIDNTLREACIGIQQNQKLSTAKTTPIEDKVFASSMNCLRTLYHANADRGLKEQALIHYMIPFYAEEDERRGKPQSIEAQREAALQAYRNLAAHFKEVVNMDFSALHTPNQAANIFDEANKKGNILNTDNNKFWRAVQEFESRISSLHASRNLVDGLASGEMKYSDIQKAMMALREQPLKSASTEQPTPETAPPDEWVDWEILPPGLLEDMQGNPSGELSDQDPYDHERQVDWKRLWRLQEYAKGWDGAYFARTTIPNLAHDKQYYAVIMPETRDGAMIEHAVADHPETGNGMYVWRGELGADSGRISLTWREVMARPRMVARQLGARCLYHTVNLEENLLEYLTSTPEAVRRRRFRK